jgi:hypothetical protein
VKYLLLAALLVWQTSDEPYPGQSRHAEPPAGWFCIHQNAELSVPAAHACSCERSCDENGQVREDQSCTVFCHADHCHCDMSHKTACK